jgi:hypothetical protein
LLATAQYRFHFLLGASIVPSSQQKNKSPEELSKHALCRLLTYFTRIVQIIQEGYWIQSFGSSIQKIGASL